MKKIIAIASLLVLIVATYTKPMKDNIFVDYYKKLISEQIEKIKLEKAPDWEKFDHEVNQSLQQLDRFGPYGKQEAENYREQINNLKLPALLTPLAVLEIDIQQLSSNIEEYFTNLLDGKIPLGKFTARPFIERLQKLEEDLPKMTTKEKSQIETKLNTTKETIGDLQIKYVNKVLATVYKQLDIIAEDIAKDVTKEHAIAIYNKINQNFTLLALLADLKGLKGGMEFSDYFDLAMKRKDNHYVVEFKTTMQNLRKRMVDVWETIMNVIKDDKKDKRMRKNLAQAGKKLGINIKLVKATFTQYLDDPKAKFKSNKGYDHPYDDMDNYIYFMENEANKL